MQSKARRGRKSDENEMNKSVSLEMKNALLYASIVVSFINHQSVEVTRKFQIVTKNGNVILQF